MTRGTCGALCLKWILPKKNGLDPPLKLSNTFYFSPFPRGISHVLLIMCNFIHPILRLSMSSACSSCRIKAPSDIVSGLAIYFNLSLFNHYASSLFLFSMGIKGKISSRTYYIFNIPTLCFHSAKVTHICITIYHIKCSQCHVTPDV